MTTAVPHDPLRIGTRGSALALTQTGIVADDIATETGATTELVTITTAGDRSNEPLSRAGGAGLFTGALRDALLAGECDVIVHSLKDLPTAPHPELVIAAIPAREDARDALCARDGLTLADAPRGRARRHRLAAPRGAAAPARAPTSSRRHPRQRRHAPRARGGGRSGCRAPRRRGPARASVAPTSSPSYLDLDRWPTAPGQGALAIEVRRGDEDLVRALDHAETRAAVEAERHVLALLEAGCSAPVGAHAVVDAGLLLPLGERLQPRRHDRADRSHAAELAGRRRGAPTSRHPPPGNCSTPAPPT